MSTLEKLLFNCFAQFWSLEEAKKKFNERERNDDDTENFMSLSFAKTICKLHCKAKTIKVDRSLQAEPVQVR